MSDNTHITPKVAVNVIIRKGSKILLGERIRSEGNQWSFPGGHLELGESILNCAQREVLEETGLKLQNIKLSPYITEDIFDIENHYISIYVLADYLEGEPRVVEPNKCAGWDWFEWDHLPQPAFISLREFLKNKYDPFI